MDKAQPEDAEILKWAKLFKASTWEELLALADENDIFMEVCDTMYALSQDATIINAINGFHALGLSDEEICQYLQLENLPQ